MVEPLSLFLEEKRTYKEALSSEASINSDPLSALRIIVCIPCDDRLKLSEAVGSVIPTPAYALISGYLA
jgi:hypothetical protein